MKLTARVVLVLVCVAVFQTSAGAQVVFNGNQTGLPPFGAFHGSDFENVSLSNGNLHVEIPIATLPQRGGNGGVFKYVYDTQGWNAVWIPVANGNPLAPGYYVVNPTSDDKGWRFVDVANRNAFGYNYDLTVVKCTQIPPQNNYTLYTNYTVKDSRGTRHQVPLRKEGDGSSSTPVCLAQIASVPTVDGSGFIAKLGANGHAIATLIGPGGEQGGADANGNMWSGGLDTLGKTPYVTFNASNVTYTTPLGATIVGPGYTTITVKDSGGVDRVFRIDYTARDIKSDICPHVSPNANCVESSQFARLVLSKISLPNIDGTTRFFQFTWDNGAAAVGMGNLTKIDLPNGGYVSYAYTTRAFRSPLLGTHLPWSGLGSVTQRTVNDGSQSSTWTYNGGTVTSPSYNGVQNDEVHLFSNGFETDVTYYNGSSASGTVLRTVHKDYVSEVEPVNGMDANTRPIRETTTLDNGLVTKVETDYETFTYAYSGADGYCNPCTTTRLNPLERREYAYGSGAAGALVRKTGYTYQHTGNQSYIDANIVNRVKVTSTYDGSGTLKAQTQNEYDVYNYSDMGSMQPSGAVQHDTNKGTAFTTRGNVTATKLWRNTDGALLETRHQYDDAGNILKTRDPLSHFTNFDYTDNWANATCAPAGQAKAFPKLITNALGHVMTKSYNSCTGTVASVKDPNNQTTTYSYDPRNRPDVMNLPDGGQSDFDYDEANRIVTLKKKRTSTATIYSKTSFDPLGRITQTQVCEDGTLSCATSIRTATTYDSLDRVAQTYNPTRCNPPTTSCGESTWGFTSYVYDALGRTSTVIPPDGSSSSNNIATTYPGNCTTVTDQAGKARKNCSDALGRVTQVFEDPSGSNYETDYTYDAPGNLLTVNQKGGSANSADWRTRTFTYNSLSQLLTATNPESGLITYTYDNDGNVKTRVAPFGASTVTTTYNYDALDRITSKTYSDGGTAGVTYVYDESTVWGNAETNYVGRLTSEYNSNASGTLTENVFNYDPLGRPVRRAQCQPLNCAAASQNAFYTFDLAGNPTSLRMVQTGVFDVTLSYGYDSTGRPANVTSSLVDAQHPATIFTVDPSSGYFPGGQLKKALFGNGVTQADVYDKRLQRCRVNVNTSGGGLSLCSDALPTGNIQDFNYGYNLGVSDNGNVASWVGAGNQVFNRSYSYDSLNRISTLNQTSGNVTGCSSVYALSWGYDAWGNRNNQNVTSGTCNSFHNTADQKNRLTGTPYTYDAAGNMTHDASHSYTYDAENRIISVDGGSTTYLYNAEGQRVQKTTGGAWRNYVFDDLGNVIAETYSTGWGPGYVYSAGQLVAQYSNGTTYFVHKDHLGSTRLITALDKSVFDSMDFLPFGEQIAGDTGTTHKFTGKERDSESNLDNFGARYMGSSLGRFMTPDWSPAPTGIPYGNLSEPQSLNLYSYTRNNPTSYTDPNGHECPLCPTSLPEPTPADWALIEAAGAGGASAAPILILGALPIAGAVFAATHPAAAPEEGCLGPQCEMFVYSNPEKTPASPSETTPPKPTPPAPPPMAEEEHKSGARPSTTQDHETGKSRKRRDKGGEKGDKRREDKGMFPRKRPSWYPKKGSWPPKPPKPEDPPPPPKPKKDDEKK